MIGTFKGAEIRTEGDSFYVVFDSVSDAVQAGLAIVASIERKDTGQPAHRIMVGIGVHAGEVEDSTEGIVSGAVNVAARICAQAEPGEVLVRPRGGHHRWHPAAGGLGVGVRRLVS